MHPQGRARVQFFEETGEMWTVGEVIYVVLAVLRATTKKGRQFFWGVGEKCTPDKILAMPMLTYEKLTISMRFTKNLR